VDPERLFKVWICDTSNFEITHLQGGAQGFTLIQEQSKLRRIPPTQKTTKNLGNDIRREHIEESFNGPSDGSTYARACYETQTVAGPVYTFFIQ